MDLQRTAEIIKLVSDGVSIADRLASSMGLGTPRAQALRVLKRARRRLAKAKTAQTTYWRNWYAEQGAADLALARELLIVAGLQVPESLR